MKILTLDKFQIAGFALSIIVSLILLLLGRDTETSIILGLVLSILVQLFDLQMRFSSSEEKLLGASALDKAMYKEEQLLENIQVIVDDYLSIQHGWFELFKQKANNSISECKVELHSLREGVYFAPLKSPYTLGAKALEQYAQLSVKSISSANIEYWRSSYAQKYFDAVSSIIIQRNIKFTKIFLQKPDVLQSYKDVIDKFLSCGADVYLVFIDDVPINFVQDMILVDDKISATLDLASNNQVRGQIISINPANVARTIENFAQIMRFAHKP